MRRRYGSLAAALLIAAVCWMGVHAAQPASGEQYIGKWTGTWEGGGSGGEFNLTLERGADGAVTGAVSVTNPDYTAKFVLLSFEGNKMNGRYSYPPDEQADIMTTATFEGGKATGTWNMVPKGQEMALATGTWSVTKQ